MELWATTSVILITAVLTWIGHAIVANLQRRTDKDRALESEKRESYKQLIHLLYDILASVKKKNVEEQQKDFETRFFELVRDMTVYASDEVLRLFIKMKNHQEGADPNIVLQTFADLLLAIRRDLGHSNTTISKRELLSTFITDIEKLELEE